MGRHYAGVLGFLAFSMMLLRSVLRGGGLEASVEQALWAMAGFALLGFIAGQWADWIVGDSVKSRLAADMAAEAAEKTKQPIRAT